MHRRPFEGRHLASENDENSEKRELKEGSSFRFQLYLCEHSFRLKKQFNLCPFHIYQAMYIKCFQTIKNFMRQANLLLFEAG